MSRFALTWSLSALAAAVCAACGSSGPPTRSSTPMEMVDPVFDRSEVVVIDLRDPNPVWMVREGFVFVFDDLGGRAAPGVTGRTETQPTDVRGFDDGVLWVCYEDGIARFTGGMWTMNVIRWPNIFGETVDGNLGCEAIDGRVGNEPWVAMSGLVDTSTLDEGYPICHFVPDDGAWSCATYDTPLDSFTRTSDHNWFIERAPGEDILRVQDTGGAESRVLRVDLGPVTGIDAIIPAPDAERVLVLPTDPEQLPRLVGPAGFTRNVEDSGPTAVAGADDLYTAVLEDRFREVCDANDVCVNEYDWTQVVVYRLNEGARTEVGHFDFLEQGGFDVFINVVDGDIYVDAGGTWLRVVQ